MSNNPIVNKAVRSDSLRLVEDERNKHEGNQAIDHCHQAG
jgi:hypothetical protein